MTISISFLLLLTATFWTCTSPLTKESSTALVADSTGLDSLAINTFPTDNQQDTLTPIWGYRFSIEGDFNGDGKLDTLVEHFKEEATDEETNKFYKEVEYDIEYQYYNQDLRRVYTTLHSTDGSVTPFLRSSTLGFSWLETIGDIDNNGTEEIGFVFNNADASNMNQFSIYTLKDSTWEELHSFTVREFNFPPIPDHFVNYGLFGPMDAQPIQDSNLQQQLIQLIDSFQYVQLIAPYIMEYRTTGDPCEIYYQLVADVPTTDTLIWIEAVNLELPPFMEKCWLQFDLKEYRKKDQEEILEELKQGKHEICDPISEFTRRVFLKKNQ